MRYASSCLVFLIGTLLCGRSAFSGEEPNSPLVLGTPYQTVKPPIVGLACLPESGQVLIQTAKGLSTLDMATGKVIASAKLEPFPDNVAVKLERHPAYATNRGFLTVSADGKTAYSYDAMGVYTYELPLSGTPKSRVANRGKTIAPLMGITHVGKFDFAFGINSRGNLFECRSTPGETDSNTGLVKTALPRVRISFLDHPLPAMAGGGQYVAIGGADGRIQIWDTTEKTDLFPIGVGLVAGLAITRDGKTLAAISYGKQAPARGPHVQLFSLPDGKEIASWATKGRRLAFSPDGSVLAVVVASKSGTLRSHIELCDPRTGKALQEIAVPMESLNCFDFTPDGKTFVAGGESGILYQWNVETGKPKGPATSPPPAVSSIAFAADGGFTTIHWDGAVRNWSADGRLGKSFVVHDKEAVLTIRSRDGKTIYSAGSLHDGTIRAYDAATGKELRRLELPGQRSAATRLAESPDGKHLYAGVTDEGIVRIDVESFKIVGTLKPKNPSPASFGGAANDIAFAADSTMVTRDYDRLRVWELKDDREVRSQNYPVANWTLGKWRPSIAVSPDGRRYLTSGGLNFQVHDIAKGPIAGAVNVANPENLTATAVAYITDKLIAVGDSSGKIRLVDVDKKETAGRIIGEHLGPVTCLAVSPDGKRLASGSTDTTAKIWTLPQN